MMPGERAGGQHAHLCIATTYVAAASAMYLQMSSGRTRSGLADPRRSCLPCITAHTMSSTDARSCAAARCCCSTGCAAGSGAPGATGAADALDEQALLDMAPGCFPHLRTTYAVRGLQ